MQAKLMSECTESIDNVKRVKHILSTGEMIEDQGLITLSSTDKQTNVIERWELLQAQMQTYGKELNYQQDLTRHHKLDSDLREVTKWLDAMLPELERLHRAEKHPSIGDIESNIHKLKNVQKTFGSYKALMISANLTGQELLHREATEPEDLKTKLQVANQKWTQACATLDAWENHLHRELLQCQEFHEKLHSLLLWLAGAESQRYMVNIHDPNVDLSILQKHRDALKVVHQELQGREGEVLFLQRLSSHILHVKQGEESIEAKEKVHVISNKLRLLLRQFTQDLSTLQVRLEPEGLSGDVVDVRSAAGVPPLMDEESRAVERGPSGSDKKPQKDVSPGRPFLYRVLRAAFPLHLLFLLLLVMACLAPLSEDSCALSNNFARSFYPMLRYTNGPPPT